MVYLRKFKDVAEANVEGGKGFYSPHVSYLEGKTVINYAHPSVEKFTATFDERGKMTVNS